MNEAPSLKRISESWTTGFSADTALQAPIAAAQTQVLVASASEEFCRALWGVIHFRLEEWKWKHGSPPDRTYLEGLLAVNRWAGMADDDVPAYGWTGRRFDTFADLIGRLIQEKYEPMTELVEKVSASIFWAVVTLAEAADGSHGAVPAYSYLESARINDVLDYAGSMVDHMKAIQPLVTRGAKFSPGRREGTVDGFSRVLDRVLADDPNVSNKDAWRRLPEFAPDEITSVDPDTLEWRGSGSRAICVSESTGAFAARMADARKRRKG